MRKTFLLVLILCLTLACPPTFAAGVEIAIGGWQQSPGGDISYKALSDDDKLDLENDLGYEAENRFMGRVKIDMPLVMPNIYILAAPMEFEGTGRKDVDFIFGDQNFSGEVDFDSKITLNQYDVGFYWGIPGIRTATLGKFNIDIGLNARFLDLAAEITGESADIPGQTIQEKESVTLVVPLIYVAAQIMPTEKFAIEAEARGLAVGGNSLISLMGRLRYQFAGPAFIAGGYRVDTLDIDEDDVVVDIGFGGPFLEVGVTF